MTTFAFHALEVLSPFLASFIAFDLFYVRLVKRRGNIKVKYEKYVGILKEEKQKTKVKTKITGPKDNFFFFKLLFA